jgi:two-component system, LytTR family, sensor kinase
MIDYFTCKKSKINFYNPILSLQHFYILTSKYFFYIYFVKKKLYITALITSPIIALYGASPFYIFDKILLPTFLFLIIGLTVNVFLVWVVHIYFAQKFPSINNYARFFYTYLVNIAVRLVFFFIDPLVNMPKPDFAENYIAYPILTSFALNAIVMVIVNSIVNGYKKAAAEQQVNELKLQNSEAQKQVLMQQLQPHFLFNALSNLKSLIKENATDAEAYTIKLSEFLRYSVEAHKNELINVEKELDFTKDYIDLQKVRFGNAFDYTIDIPNTVLQNQVPILALQILVENVFKHNYFTEKNPLTFSISFKDNAIHVWNKKTSLRLSEKTRTGLDNLQKRYLLTMNKSITIIDTETDFTVQIPILEK